MNEDIMTQDPGKGRKIKAGQLEDNGVFFKRVRRKDHHYREVPGYAIQTDVVERLKEEKVKKIIIFEEDTGDVYSSSLENFLLHGGSDKWSVGHGKQVLLIDEYWTKEESVAKARETAKTEKVGKQEQILTDYA